MPYTIKRVANKWFVERVDGVRFGAHDCEGDAGRQLKALEAAAPRPKLVDLRALHLHRALGTARVETINGREHLIVPVIALMEGVIHAVNAETPEFVPLSTLQKAAPTWNGKPVTVYHPKSSDGKQCSALAQGIAETHHIGFIRNSRIEGTKLLQEACIDKVRAKTLAPDMWQRLLEDNWEEVSVGAYVVTDNKPGKYTNGKAFNGTWIDTAGDHLAFLPGGRGACSIEMGCGAHRAAMRVCEAGLELETAIEPPTPKPALKACVAYTALEGLSLDERMSAVNDAVNKRWNDNGAGSAMPAAYAYAKQVFDSSVIVSVGAKTFAVPYDVADDGTVTLGKATEVKVTYVAAEHDCHCGGACDECQEHRALGDVEGHEFHGNQYTAAHGAASTAHETARSAHKLAAEANKEAAKPGASARIKEIANVQSAKADQLSRNADALTQGINDKGMTRVREESAAAQHSAEAANRANGESDNPTKDDFFRASVYHSDAATAHGQASVSHQMHERRSKKLNSLAAGKMTPCGACDGTGQVKGDDGKQGDCPACGGEGKLRAAAGARHSAGDMKMIQGVHDHAVSLGAACDRGNM